MLDMVRVGERISSLRRACGMSQEALSERLFVTRQALSKWENGLSVPGVDMLIEMSKIFRVSFEEILCLDNGELEIDESDVFRGHSRDYIVKMIAEGRLGARLADVFYQLSPSERIYILGRIREGELAVEREEIRHCLSRDEMNYLFGIEETAKILKEGKV